MEYKFITNWRVESTVEEVTEILEQPTELPRWWPSVYLDVRELEPGDDDGVGKIISLYTKGWLPYTLLWQLKRTESRSPHGFSIEAWGDLEGSGKWAFEQDGSWVQITYDWRVNANKPILRYLSFILKPLFSANHDWAMKRGEESLKLEILRRHAKNEEERAAIPSPPKPTFANLIKKRRALETIQIPASESPEKS